MPNPGDAYGSFVGSVDAGTLMRARQLALQQQQAEQRASIINALTQGGGMSPSPDAGYGAGAPPPVQPAPSAPDPTYTAPSGGPPTPSPVSPPPLNPGGPSGPSAASLAGGPQPQMQPGGMQRPQGLPGGGPPQQSQFLGLLRRLRADPKNQGVPDNVLLNYALKIYPPNQQTAEERMLTQVLLANQSNTTKRDIAGETDKRDRDIADLRAELGRRGQDMALQRALDIISSRESEGDKNRGLKEREDKLKYDLAGNAQISDDDAKYLAQMWRAGGDAPKSLGYGNVGAANRQKVVKALRALGTSPEEVVMAQAEMQGTRSAFRALGTRQVGIGVGTAEMQQFAPLVLDASNSVDRTRFKSLNSVYESALQGTGDENVIRLVDSVNAFKQAYAQVVARGGRSSDDARKRADEVLNGAWSKGQLQAGMDQLMKEADAATRATGTVRSEIAGGSPAAPPAAASPNAGWSVEEVK